MVSSTVTDSTSHIHTTTTDPTTSPTFVFNPTGKAVDMTAAEVASRPVEDEFKDAVDFIAHAKKEAMALARKPLPPMDSLPSEVKLEFYGLFKQATEGPCNIPQPAFYFPLERAKWGGWRKHKMMGKEEAMGKYIETLTMYLPGWRTCANPSKPGTPADEADKPDSEPLCKHRQNVTPPRSPTVDAPPAAAVPAIRVPAPAQRETSPAEAAGPAKDRMEDICGQGLPLDQEFECAVGFVTRATVDQKIRARSADMAPLTTMSNDQLLQFYSLFKQATDGPCTRGPPPMYRAVERAKWAAWRKLGYLSKNGAKRDYIRALQAEFPQWAPLWIAEGEQLYGGDLTKLPSSTHIHEDLFSPARRVPSQNDIKSMGGPSTPRRIVSGGSLTPGVPQPLASRTAPTGSPTPSGTRMASAGTHYESAVSGAMLSNALSAHSGASDHDASTEHEQSSGGCVLRMTNANSFSSLSECQIRDEILELRSAVRHVESVVHEYRVSADTAIKGMRAELTAELSRRESSDAGPRNGGGVMQWEGWTTVGQVAAAGLAAAASYAAWRRFMRQRR